MVVKGRRRPLPVMDAPAKEHAVYVLKYLRFRDLSRLFRIRRNLFETLSLVPFPRIDADKWPFPPFLSRFTNALYIYPSPLFPAGSHCSRDTKMAALKLTLIYQCLQDNETMECVKHPLFLFCRGKTT